MKTILFTTAAILGVLASLNAQVTRERQEKLTPDLVLESLVEGNARFVANTPKPKHNPERIRATESGQHPKAVILSCLDSRVPVETVFDVGIGDCFVGRVAGNIVDTDQLGSMEFATKVVGARLVMVLGHTRCGAVVGAINKVEMGNLTSLLKKIKPAVSEVKGFQPDQRTSKNEAFVDAVIAQNVRQTIGNIRKGSSILAALEKSGDIKIVGGVYDIENGKVELLKE